MSSLEEQRRKYGVKKAKRTLAAILFVCVMIVGVLLIASPYIITNIVTPYALEEAKAVTRDVKPNKIQDNQQRIQQKLNQLKDKEQYGEISMIDPNINYNPDNVRSVDRVPIGKKVNIDYMVGQLYIPNVGLNIPVLEGLTNDNLDVASGTMKPFQVMGKGNYAIAGHHMYDADELFSPLSRVRDYDAIYLTDKAKVYEYIVTDTFVVPPSEGKVIDDAQGEEIITLVTCTDPQGTARLIVRGKLTKSYKLSKAPQDIRTAFNID